jgi:hypothetical protein
LAAIEALKINVLARGFYRVEHQAQHQIERRRL